MKTVFLGAAIALAGAAPAGAAVSLKFSGTTDAALETYLTGTLGLPTVGASALVPLERAVGEARMGSTTDARRLGFHTPTAGSGLPEPVGTGVTNALTNFSPVGASNTPWTNGQAVAFSIKRVNDTLTYKVGTTEWSATAAYFLDINAFVLRARSNGVAPRDHNSVLLDELSFNGQSFADVSAANGALSVQLFSGLSGDFTLSGRYTFSWSGTAPRASELTSQIKLIQLPAVPEPASWTLMIAGFGLAGAALRRRDRRLTVTA